MNNFFQYQDDKEYKYKILVYPNITFMKDLEKDSYVVVLRNVIKELNKVRDDIFWTILSPEQLIVYTSQDSVSCNGFADGNCHC